MVDETELTNARRERYDARAEAQRIRDRVARDEDERLEQARHHDRAVALLRRVADEVGRCNHYATIHGWQCPCFLAEVARFLAGPSEGAAS